MACSGPEGYHNTGINSGKRCEIEHRKHTLSSLLQSPSFRSNTLFFFYTDILHFNLPLSWQTSKTDSRSHFINMQQYANGLDLLVCVCFISPGFFLSVPCCRSLHPSLLFSSLGSIDTQKTQWTHLCITAIHVFPHCCVCVCVSADVRAILICSRRGNTAL